MWNMVKMQEARSKHASMDEHGRTWSIQARWEKHKMQTNTY